MRTDTIAPEYRIACVEKVPRRRGRVGAAGLRLGTTLVREIQKVVAGAGLPGTWDVVAGTINTVARGAVAAPITVVDVAKFNEQHIHDIVVSLARSQKESPYRGYVIVIDAKSKVDATYEMKLRKLFPYPGLVAVTQSLDHTGWALRNFALMRQLAQELAQGKVEPSRVSALDDIKKVVEVTQDLRVAKGRLSAKLVAGLFGFTMREFALLLGRTPQAVNQTPDAESLQDALKYFERVARVRLVLKDNEMFRKWLRMSIPALDDRAPETFLREKKWQALADFVDDILTGAPG